MGTEHESLAGMAYGCRTAQAHGVEFSITSGDFSFRLYPLSR